MIKNSSKNENDDVVQQTQLPHDLIAQRILARLPIKPLLLFKSVSKQWFSTLSSHNFTHTHTISPRTSLSESLIIRSDSGFQCFCYKNGEMNLVNLEVDFGVLDDNLVLVGSCNGLVCLGSVSGSMFVIWNPVISKFRVYPDDSEICGFSTRRCLITWGFGYVSAIDDYKVVRISKRVSDPSMGIHVFSLRLNKWKRIDENSSCHPDFFDLRIANRVRRQGVLVGETLYWLDGVPPMFGEHQRKIIYFDLGHELFNTFPHLDVSSSLIWSTGGNSLGFDEFLCVLKGCLSKYCSYLSGEGVITISKYPGATEQIHVSNELLDSACENLIGFTGSDKIFTIYCASRVPHVGMIDPSLQPMNHTPLKTLQRTWNVGKIVTYSPSLISPAAIAYTFESSI